MIHIRMLRDWEHRPGPDEGGDVLILPRKHVLSLEDDYIGLRAISAGAAEAAMPLDEEQQYRLKVITAAAAHDDAAVQALIDGAGDPAPPADPAVKEKT